MIRVDIEMMFEGGAGLSLVGVDAATAESVQEAYRRKLKGEAVPFVEILVPQESGEVSEFIIDLARVLTLSTTGRAME